MAKLIQQLIQGAVAQAGQEIVKIKDPVASEQQDKYRLKGLNFKSNDINVMPRDPAGNIIVENLDINSSILIIEPTTSNITTDSVSKIIDTQFNYFKFPARVRVEDDEDIDLDIDLDFSQEQQGQDPIYARYKPSENRKILSDPSGQGIASGILIDEIEEGQLQKRANRYYITKEIKESGVDLRFRIKINFRYDSFATDFNTTYFYIARSGPDKYLQRDYIQYFNFEDPYAGGGKISQYQVQNATKDVVIANSEFEVGDTFSITALAGSNTNDKYSTINADQTYWSITDASKNVDEWNREITSPISQQTAPAQPVSPQNTIR